MSRWFRVHDDLVDDPKVQLLSGDLVKALLNLWCLASQNDGILPPMKDMAFKLRMKPPQVAAIIAELADAGLIDREDDTFRPHNWAARQYKSDVSTERVKRFRNGKRNVSETVSETICSVSVSASVSEDAFKKEEKKKVEPLSDFEFEDFWNLWPNKVGKPAALRAFVGARKRAGLDAIVEGVFAYIREKPPDRPWLNPATFLNQNRWEDKPAQVQNGKSQVQSGSLIAAIDRKLAALEAEERTDFALPENPVLRISG